VITDDIEFYKAVNEWASLIEYGDIEAYKSKFVDTRSFFGDEKISEGVKLSGNLIKNL